MWVGKSVGCGKIVNFLLILWLSLLFSQLAMQMHYTHGDIIFATARLTEAMLCSMHSRNKLFLPKWYAEYEEQSVDGRVRRIFNYLFVLVFIAVYYPGSHVNKHYIIIIFIHHSCYAYALKWAFSCAVFTGPRDVKIFSVYSCLHRFLYPSQKGFLRQSLYPLIKR